MQVMGYIRVSSIGQTEKDGPVRQRKAIEDFVTVNKLTLDSSNIYSEAIKGATAGEDRPAFSAMLARILEIRAAGGEAAGIVIERAERLARDLIEGELIFRECRKLGIKVFATDRGFIDLVSDDTCPTAKMIRQIIGAVAEFDKSSLVQKMRLARDRIRKEKGFCEGRPPYGSGVGERQCLELIIALHKTGAGNTEIANQLNATGFRTRSGHAWYPQLIPKKIKLIGLTKNGQ